MPYKRPKDFWGRNTSAQMEDSDQVLEGSIQTGDVDVERGNVLELLGWITKESRVTWAPLRMCHILLSCSLHLSDGHFLLHAGGLLPWGLTISQLTVPSGKCHWDLLHHSLSVQSLRVFR